MGYLRYDGRMSRAMREIVRVRDVSISHFPYQFLFLQGESVIEYTEIGCACGGRFNFPADGHCSLLFLFLLYEEVFFSEVSMSVTAAMITGENCPVACRGAWLH